MPNTSNKNPSARELLEQCFRLLARLVDPSCGTTREAEELVDELNRFLNAPKGNKTTKREARVAFVRDNPDIRRYLESRMTGSVYEWCGEPGARIVLEKAREQGIYSAKTIDKDVLCGLRGVCKQLQKHDH